MLLPRYRRAAVLALGLLVAPLLLSPPAPEPAATGPLARLLPATAKAAPGESNRADAACPQASLPGLALPHSVRSLRAGEPLTIIAFGSSSTEGAGASAPGATYPSQLEARLRAALPGLALRVLNRGIGGEDVREMLARLGPDVLAWHPTLVIWQAGANAVLRGMDSAEFQALLAGGVAQIQQAGADLVLMDSQRSPRILAKPRHPLFDAALRDLATQTGVSLFSRATLMQDWAEAGVAHEAVLGPDGLHHNDRGYACLAAALAGSILQVLRPPATLAGR